jgi:hypothetical protein
MFKPKQPKITVHVKSSLQDYKVKREVQVSSDGQRYYVTMTPPTSAKGGWELNIKDRVRKDKKGFYCEAIEGQKEALKLDIPNNELRGKEWTTDDVKEFANLQIFKAHYSKLLGDLIAAVKPFLFVIIGLTIVAVIVSGVSIYMATKIPEQIITILQPPPTPTPPLIG